MTATAVTTYQYDAANRLLQSDIQGGDTTIYDWDNASRLITTTVASTVSRVYGYSQDGDLLSALVDEATDWRFSSAAYWLNGQMRETAVTLSGVAW